MGAKIQKKNEISVKNFIFTFIVDRLKTEI